MDRGQMNRSPMRSISRSRSKSPTFRPGRGGDRDPRDPRIENSNNTRDEWTKTTDAFLKNLGTASNKPNEQNPYMGRSHGGYPIPNPGYTDQRPYYSNQHSAEMGSGPPGNHMSNRPTGQSGQQLSQQSNVAQGNEMDRNFHERRRYNDG